MLIELPIDILSVITGLLLSKDITSLYLCGNHQLSDYLNEGGVVDVVHVGVTKRNVVTLSRYFPQCHSLIEVKQCNSLPPFIHRLRSRLQSLVIRSYPEIACDLELDVSKLNQFSFPQLKHLSISCIHNLQYHHLTTLPSTLTYLKLDHARLYDDMITHLPRGLTHLEWPDDGELTDACIVYLPRGLKYLDLSSTCTTNRTIQFTDKQIYQLPRQLVHLGLSSELLTDACIPHLPPSLRHLHVQCHRTFTDACISYLPKTLRSLRLDSNNRITDAGIAMLPRELTSLTLGGSRLTDGCVLHLPPHLTYLALLENQQWSDMCLTSLPPSLRHLLLRINQTITTLSTNLDLSSENSHTDTFQPIDIYTGILPRHLKTLDLGYNMNLTDRDMAHLPPSLVYLDIDSNKVTDDGLALLPDGLTYLSLYSSNNITDDGIKRLPRTLIHLTMSLASELTDMAISDLPPHLTYLDLIGATKLTNKCVAQFPPSLKHLFLNGSSLTPAFLLDLPSDLETLYISKKLISI